jgi:lipopolysaccharide export system permease protein
MSFLGLIDRYLARRVLITTAIVWAVLVGFDAIGAFANELDEIGQGNYSLSHAALYIFFTIPRRMYELFPYVVVMGSLLGLGGLAARSELTAMRAAGVSRLRIGLGVVIAIGLLTIIMMVNMETIAPAAEQRSQAIVNEGKTNQIINARFSGLWARDGNMFLNARAGGERKIGEKSTLELQDMRLFEMNDDGQLMAIIKARTGVRVENGWILNTVEKTRFEPNQVDVTTQSEWFWPSNLDRRTLEVAIVRDRFISTRELRSNIAYLQRSKLDAEKFVNAYWARWFFPINAIVLCIATLPFAFSSLRSGGFGKRLFYGIVLGIGFLLSQRLFVDLSSVYHFDVRIAMAIPPLLMLGLSVVLFRRTH